MTMQRVQMLLEPEQRQKLTELARVQNKSIAEITRHVIDIGLEKMSKNEQLDRMVATLEAAQQLRGSMPMLEINVVTDIRLMREERDNELLSRD